MPAATIDVTTYRARYRRPFRIHGSTYEFEDLVRVRIESRGVVAFGEGVPVDYRGESAADCCAHLRRSAQSLLADEPSAVALLGQRLAAWDGPSGAKQALDGAAHDLLGKLHNRPSWQLLGTGRDVPVTSLTVGLDESAATAELVTVTGRDGAHPLKLKLGADDDLARVRAALTINPRVRVDANGGWSPSAALQLLPQLAELGVELVEQPLPVADDAHLAELFALERRPPLVLDESCQSPADVVRLHTVADGVNVKLAKAGGIGAARDMIAAARACGLQVMLGCMSETELGISAAVQLGALVDWVDLDSHLMLQPTGWRALPLVAGAVRPTLEPGLGVLAE